MESSAPPDKQGPLSAGECVSELNPSHTQRSSCS